MESFKEVQEANKKVIKTPKDLKRALEDQNVKVSRWNKYGKDRYYLSKKGTYLSKAKVYFTFQKSDEDKYEFVEGSYFIVSGKKCYNGSVQETIDELFDNLEITEYWIDPAGGVHKDSKYDNPLSMYE